MIVLKPRIMTYQKEHLHPFFPFSNGPIAENTLFSEQTNNKIQMKFVTGFEKVIFGDVFSSIRKVLSRLKSHKANGSIKFYD